MGVLDFLKSKDPLVVVGVVCPRCQREVENLGTLAVAGETFDLFRCRTEFHTKYSDAFTSCPQGRAYWAVDADGRVFSDPTLLPFGGRWSLEDAKRIMTATLERNAARHAQAKDFDARQRACVNSACEAHLQQTSKLECGGCKRPTSVRSTFAIRCEACDRKPDWGTAKRGGICFCGGRFIAKFNDGGAK
jgi:hypothetical protein